MTVAPRCRTDRCRSPKPSRRSHAWVWAPYPTELPNPLPAAGAGPRPPGSDQRSGPRRAAGDRGRGLKTRSNDTDYRFRPHSAFGSTAPGWAPTGSRTPSWSSSPPTPAITPPCISGRRPHGTPRSSTPTPARLPAVGVRSSLEEMAELCGISGADIGDLPDHLRKDADTTSLRVLPVDFEPVVTEVVAESDRRGAAEERSPLPDAELAQALARARADQGPVRGRRAGGEGLPADGRGVRGRGRRSLPEAARRGRGERWVEGIFGLHARHEGNAIGYGSIAASASTRASCTGSATTVTCARQAAAARRRASRTGTSTPPTSPAPCRSTGGSATTNGRSTTWSTRRNRLAWRSSGRGDVLRRAPDVVRVIAEHLEDLGVCPRHRRGVAGARTAASTATVDGTSSSPRAGCARLRPGPPREVPGGHPAARDGPDGGAGPVLQGRRRDACCRAAARGIGAWIEDDIVITETGCANLSEDLAPGPASMSSAGWPRWGRLRGGRVRRDRPVLNAEPAGYPHPYAGARTPLRPRSARLPTSCRPQLVRRPTSRREPDPAARGLRWRGLRLARPQGPQGLGPVALSSQFDLHPLASRTRCRATPAKLECSQRPVHGHLPRGLRRPPEPPSTSEVAHRAGDVFLGDHFQRRGVASMAALAPAACS